MFCLPGALCTHLSGVRVPVPPGNCSRKDRKERVVAFRLKVLHWNNDSPCNNSTKETIVTYCSAFKVTFVFVM